MRTDPMSTDLKRWKVPGLAFSVGTVIGITISVSPGAYVPWPVQLLVVPGILIWDLIYVLTGGVHGSFIHTLLWLAPSSNGVAYALIALLIRRITNSRTSKPVKLK